MTTPSIHSLHIYPIKSCGSIALQEVSLDEFGFENDRRWLLVDEHGTFITQRECAALALVRTSIDDEFLHIEYDSVGKVSIPLMKEYDTVTTTSVWASPPLAVGDEGEVVAEFFREIIGNPTRLVRRAGAYRRDINSGRLYGQGHQVNFSDSHPILAASIASIEDLNFHIGDTLLVDRFRANIIINNALHPFDEDCWREIDIHGNRLLFGKLCARCVMTTINQQTAEVGKEPLATMATYRRGDAGKVFFGAYFVNVKKEGVLRVGDSINILEREG